MVGAPDAPAQLVELRETEAVRPVDDDRVDIGYIQTRLDDHTADQDVDLPLEELHHHGLKLALRHLAVAHVDDEPREKSPEVGCHALDRLHAIVYEVDLAAPVHFAQYGLDDQVCVEGRDLRPDGQAVSGWRVDDRHIAGADQRHVKRSRDRGRRHRDDVDRSAHLPDTLLVQDAELLFLVRD